MLIASIILLPGAGALLNGLVGIRAFSRRAAEVVACSTMALAFALSVAAFAPLLRLPPDARSIEVVAARWIPSLGVAWGFRLDPLSALMLLVVTGIGTLIHVYATSYMHDEPRGGVARFFCYLNLFCFFMLLLVLGSNVAVMFAGWEGVGLCSYLLIGYWYERQSAADAGRKAFITNRVGDAGFVLGMLLAFTTFGTLDFRAIQHAVAGMPVESAHAGVLTATALLLFVGACGKSAQLPLHVWLPDAMEGPTPVSALIHAATMVTAGVYMVARSAALFTHAPIAMHVVAIVGITTALMAASVALVQHDIKRVLAYSTVSQLGLMFTALGAGAFAAGTFHLMTHAFFKALLFLGAGSVIHATGGEQDLRRLGGLRRSMPTTFATMTLGALAIAGIPPLAGFFSKDEILSRVFAESPWLWLPALLTALMTAFYTTRLIALAFLGSSRGPHAPHESPRAMTVPLIVLAAGAALAGVVGLPAVLGGGNALERFLEPSFANRAMPDLAVHASRSTEFGLMLVSVLVALGGIALAWQMTVVSPNRGTAMAARFAPVHGLLARAYGIDRLYDATIVRGVFEGAGRLWAFDRRVVDGLVNFSGWLARFGSWLSGRTDRTIVDGIVNGVGVQLREASYGLRRLQSGRVQNYAMMMLFGLFAFASLYLFAR
jgi:NADH-quinone oxidoreductase subunit L